MKRLILVLSLFLIMMMIVGCEDETTKYVTSDYAPAIPQGVYSVTGNGQVTVYWLPVQDDDLKEYGVCRSDDDSLYYLIALTTDTIYVDDSVINGYTYYYAVYSVDQANNESYLSYETVFDTPRPEGSMFLFDFHSSPTGAGYDFSTNSIVAYDDINADIYLEYDVAQSTHFICKANSSTKIQDMGFTYNFDEISYPADSGWSTIGKVEGILEHTYVIRTWDNHFAKIRVKTIFESPRGLMFDWAYQTATGNRELAPPQQGDDNISSNTIDGRLIK